MAPVPLLLFAAALWAVLRLVLGLLLTSRKINAHVQVDLDWWRVTLRLPVDGGGGWLSRTATRHRHSLRAWFGVGLTAGAACMAVAVAVLLSELTTLLRPLLVPAAEAAAQPLPRLALALPWLLPAGHAVPLWGALAASLAVHEAGHALAAAVEGVHVSSTGASLILLMPAAFVEMDSAELEALPRCGLLRVACAGAWHNLVLAAVAWLAQAGTLRLGSLTASWAGGHLHLLLAYTTALSLALALLNMAPVWWLDGQQALEALCRPGRLTAVSCLPTDQWQGGSSSGRGGGGRRAAAVRWVLHAGTGLYAAVLLLHLRRVS